MAHGSICEALELWSFEALALRGSRYKRLARLPSHDFVAVLDALLVVRLGLARPAHLRRELADRVLVRALDGDRRRRRARHGQALGNREFDRVREPDDQRELLARDLRAVADAADVEVLLVAGQDALDHARDQAPGRAVERLDELRVRRALDHDALAAVDLDLDLRAEGPRELARGALDVDDGTGQVDLHLVRDVDRFSSKPRHVVTTPCR